MFIDENTIDYALDRHTGFRQEAERYRTSLGFTNNITAAGNENRQSIRGMVDLLNNLEIKFNGKQQVITIRIDAR